VERRCANLAARPVRGYESDRNNRLLRTLIDIKRRYLQELDLELKPCLTRRLILRAMYEGKFPQDELWSDEEREGWLDLRSWPGVARPHFREVADKLRAWRRWEDQAVMAVQGLLSNPLVPDGFLDAVYDRVRNVTAVRKIQRSSRSPA
jgi:hypothetical protein